MIDDPADAGIRRSRRTSFLDRAHRRLLEVLVAPMTNREVA
jgi:hypothetical protein